MSELSRFELLQLPPHAVLTKEEMARYLGMSVATFERTVAVAIYPTERTPRYIISEVLERIKEAA